MPATVTLQTLDFPSRIVAKIRGWLHDITALRATEMMKFQEEAKHIGPAPKNGNYLRGRYFSMMLNSAIRTDVDIVGIAPRGPGAHVRASPGHD